MGQNVETDGASSFPLRGPPPGSQGRPGLLRGSPSAWAAEPALCGVLVFQEGTVQDALSAPGAWEAGLWALSQSEKSVSGAYPLEPTPKSMAVCFPVPQPEPRPT